MVSLIRFIFIVCLHKFVDGKDFAELNERCGVTVQSKSKDSLPLIDHVNIPWAGFLVDESDSSRRLPITGSIISSTLFVTDAYVFHDRNSNAFKLHQNFSLVYGSSVLSMNEKQGMRVKVSHVTIHPKYKSYDGWYNRENDIALVHLETPIQIEDEIQPVCFPELADYHENIMENRTDNRTLYLYGWNKHYKTDMVGMQVDMRSSEACDSYWKSLFSNNNLGDRICANVSQANKKQLCVTHPIGVFYLKNGRFYMAGALNNFYSKRKLCSDGALHIVWKFSDQTIEWIKNNERCGIKSFTCFSDGKCISKSKLCDLHPDCADESDESLLHCSNVEMCTENEFKCQVYGKCILKSSVLDGKPDCPDGEDEKGSNPGSAAQVTLMMAGVIMCTVVALFVLTIVGF